MELSAAPRRVYFIYGDSTDGGITPDAITQVSIDALLALGIPLANIRWIYEVGLNTFIIPDMTVACTIDPITLTQEGVNVFIIPDMTVASMIDSLALTLAGGTFTIPDMTVASTMDGITLTQQDTFSDEFGSSTEQNFLTSGDGAKLYEWYALNTTRASGMDANITNAGKATIALNADNATVAFPNDAKIYKPITGDFDVEIGWTDNRANSYEAVTLSAHNTSNLNIYVRIDNYHGTGGVTESTHAYFKDGTTETEIGTGENAVANRFFRITRVGNVFTLYKKVNSGDSWTQHAQTTRTDLGTTVNIALSVQGYNTSGTYVAQFDYLRKN